MLTARLLSVLRTFRVSSTLIGLSDSSRIGGSRNTIHRRPSQQRQRQRQRWDDDEDIPYPAEHHQEAVRSSGPLQGGRVAIRDRRQDDQVQRERQVQPRLHDSTTTTARVRIRIICTKDVYRHHRHNDVDDDEDGDNNINNNNMLCGRPPQYAPAPAS